MPRMKSVIIGTAGHIDHGKTALVKALTGIDADRLEEEKRRGITIDIGFAHLELTASNGEKLRLGFVDVPGHERFVRNMLAGIGGIDVVLLVIAADESIKPQTREHFDICRLLSVRRGITVLTKSDAVDAETLDVVKLEVEEFLRGSFLDPAHSPILAVSSLTGAGLPELKQALAHIAAEVPAKDSGALAPLPIDRVFTMKGFGTVVTGPLVSGTIRKEDELEAFPSGRRGRGRGGQVHGDTTEQALAGQRSALNLAGVAVEDLARGVMLAPPETFRETQRVDASLSLLPSAKPLKDRARVHLHAYTSETVAEVGLYGEKIIKPGENAYAQLRMEAGTLLLPGALFIVRQFSPVVTIGGGVVLDATPPLRSKKGYFLKLLDEGTPERIIEGRIARQSNQGLTVPQLVAETGWLPTSIRRHLAESIRRGQILQLGDRYLHGAVVEVLRESIVSGVTVFHKENPLVAGISKEHLRETVAIPLDVLAAMLELLTSEKKLE